MDLVRKKNIFICFSLAAFVTACLFFVLFSIHNNDHTGILHVEPGKSTLYIKKYDLTVKGQDKDGVTYFFLPSYADMTAVIQDDTAGHIYLRDGSLLTDPAFGQIQEVDIDPGDGSPVPWNTAFFKSSGLYTAYIDLQGKDIRDISHDDYISSAVSLYSPFGKLEYIDSSVLIKGRGNTTWDAVKQPYEIKLSDNHPLCGMSSCSKWALLANFYDDTKILNKMIMDLSGNIGMEYAIESDWVDLYVNGEYRGNYLLCKDPGIGKGRLQLSDGYFIEKDNRTGPDSPDPHFNIGKDFFRIKDPLPVDEEDILSISSFVNEVDKDIHEGSGNEHFAHIDIPSFARRFMVDEFCFRSASMQTNCYFYNRGDTLYAGPCWDYDLVCGKPLSGTYYMDYTKSLLDDMPSDVLLWDSILLQDRLYKDYYDELYEASVPLFSETIQKNIDIYAGKIAASVAMDNALWQNDEYPVRFYKEMDNKYRYLKFFLYRRLCLLADICGQEAPLKGFDPGNKTRHTVTFDRGGEPAESLDVQDGELLSPSLLPEYDPSVYDGWFYTREQLPFSPYIPVYEDMTLELKPKG